MTDVGESLSRAHALVTIASFCGVGDLHGAILRSRCAEVAQLMEEAGAQPSAEELSQSYSPADDPLSLLLAAEALLDQIPAADRPLRLSAVRAELAGARLEAQSPAWAG